MSSLIIRSETVGISNHRFWNGRFLYRFRIQKKLLTKVGKEKGYTNLVHSLDDGISGVTMNHPDFVRMVRQLEKDDVLMFSGLLVCADCGSNLHFHFNQGNPESKYSIAPTTKATVGAVLPRTIEFDTVKRRVV